MKHLIRFDWAIKRLLRNKANFGILEGFLSELLRYDIKIDSILESESNQETKEEKNNQVDLLVRNEKGELIIIEVQNKMEQDYLMRMLFSVSKTLVENMYKGMKYYNVKKIISVNIVFFDFGQGEDYVYHGTTIFKGWNKKDILKLSSAQKALFKKTEISKLYPEYYIIKVNQFDEIAKNTLDEWIYFFKTEEIKDEFSAKGLKEAKEKLDIMKLTDAERRAYNKWVEYERQEASIVVGNYIVAKEEGRMEGRKAGREEGREAGRLEGEQNKEKYAAEIAEKREKQKQIEMAANCLKNGLSIELTAQLTGLTEKEIGKIEY